MTEVALKWQSQQEDIRHNKEMEAHNRAALAYDYASLGERYAELGQRQSEFAQSKYEYERSQGEKERAQQVTEKQNRAKIIKEYIGLGWDVLKDVSSKVGGTIRYGKQLSLF